MSYTNQTQHYGLPQYVGTDVPAWLTDINGAFSAIDVGMNTSKTQADSAATAAGQAANDIAALTTTVNAQAAQISAAAQSASAAQTTANTADGKADANTSAISGLDARVAALEGGGAASLTIDELNYTGPMSSAFGSTFVSAVQNLVPPAGKTLDDLVSLTTVSSNVGSWIFMGGAGQYYHMSATAQAAANIKAVALYK